MSDRHPTYEGTHVDELQRLLNEQAHHIASLHKQITGLVTAMKLLQEMVQLNRDDIHLLQGELPCSKQDS